MGVQTWCFHDLGFDTMLSRIESLGLSTIELVEEHLPLNSSEQQIAVAKSKLERAGIKAIGLYTDAFASNEAQTRKVFDFGKKMGFGFFNGMPKQDTLPLLNRLIPEYKVGIAIHNHGPRSTYDKLEDLTSLLNQYEHLSACIDIGHFVRSGVDPVHAIRSIGQRAIELHVKDLTADDKNTVVGQGKVDMPAILKALKEVNFNGFLTLEYEGDWKDIDKRMKGMRESLSYLSRLVNQPQS
jgi:inosose dehydratase